MSESIELKVVSILISRWRNLLNTYYRFNSHKIAYARVTASFAGREQQVITDEAGFFEIKLKFDTPTQVHEIWNDVLLELPDYRGQTGAQAIAQVMIPSEDAQFGVISDLDDTVLKSDVINRLKLARNTFLRNSHTRLPFAGVAEFYRALQSGTQNQVNPIFYVSNSPWNLHDLIADFFEVRGIPRGPIFLKRLRLAPSSFRTSALVRHKLACIEHLLAVYPKLSFILIGDSGEKDPETYLQAIVHNPGRIAAAYIRDVTGTARHQQLQTIVAEARASGVEMLLAADTAAAAEHAAEHGFILPEVLPNIHRERKEDEQVNK